MVARSDGGAGVARQPSGKSSAFTVVTSIPSGNSTTITRCAGAREGDACTKVSSTASAMDSDVYTAGRPMGVHLPPTRNVPSPDSAVRT